MKKILFVLSMLLVLSTQAVARWPEETITIIVPAPPGGPSDIISRSLQPKLEKELGVPVIIKNMPGGSYLVAGRHLTSQSNNNHTFLIIDAIWPASTYFIDPETVEQFRSINIVAQSPMCLSSKFGITKEDFLKASRDKVQANVAVNGLNSIHYRWLSNVETGIKWTEIPYTGASPIVTAMAGEQVDYGVLSLGIFKPMMDAKKIRCQMISTINRNPEFPDVPTFRELGFKGEPTYQWWGFSTRKDTKEEAVQGFASAIEKILKQGHSVALPGMTFEHAPEKLADKLVKDTIKKFSK